MIVLDKAVGQTPLDVIRAYKLDHPDMKDVPMAYAGRLDPMASGKLLVLVGDECKHQERYHALDKRYRFEVLLGTNSDTGDILGLIDWKKITAFNEKDLTRVAKGLVGKLSLPYPKFSSRTVKGKPLHVWTLENRLSEIEIPVANTTVYKLRLLNIKLVEAEAIYRDALERIESIPPVTEESKKLGRDFRRDDVRVAWKVWLENHRHQQLQVAEFECICSSGTYMRSLAEEIGRRLKVPALAYSIHRDVIGRYLPLPFGLGLWTKRY